MFFFGFVLYFLFGRPKRSQQPLGKVVHGIPDGEEADGEDGKEDDDDVPRVYADRIGIDNEGSCGRTECHEAECLL